VADVPGTLASALRDRYRLEQELGTGGMATVYLAHDLKHDRKVALKTLRPDVAQSVGSEQFLREIQLAAKLSHPNILALFDSGDAGGVLYYVMPRVEGHSLRDRLDKTPMLPVDEAVRIAVEVAGALDYAHRHGVVHRDIKPENIMLHDGHALVADFGIGKALSSVGSGGVTQAGMSVGTPAYMSPEQAAGESVDGRSDLYSLGCVLYEMLVGEQPFTGSTVQALIAKRFVQTPAGVAALREGVSRPVARAVQKALARTPIDRYETAALFVTALSEVEDPTLRLAAPEKSLAVLPFASQSNDPENEFFADGITEEILNALSQIRDLKVAGRTSSFSFKGRNLDLRTIGEQLNVRTVLEGSVRRSGKRVRITAQLSDATDGFRLWSERYDREIEDVFAVQDEIAAAIAEQLKTTLAAGSASRAQRATDNIEAYEAYLKGRTLLYQRGAGIKQGMALMEKALTLDPEYALAWAGLADGYIMLGYFGLLPPEVTWPRARDAVGRAIEFGPDTAEAHTALAQLCLLFEWDWTGGERAFRRALELNPGYLQGSGWYNAYYLAFSAGRWDEAIEGSLALQRQDRLSGYLAASLSGLYALRPTPYPAEAMEQARRAMALAPDAYLTLIVQVLAHQASGDWPATSAAGDAALAAHGRAIEMLTLLSLAAVEAEEIDVARDLYDEMRLRARREYVSPMCVALVAAALGERDVAITSAREAHSRHDPALVFYALRGAGVRFLRALPEFQEILVAIKIPGWKGSGGRDPVS
jgi:eukaryotic-like serine/threonine-protein kinase